MGALHACRASRACVSDAWQLWPGTVVHARHVCLPGALDCCSLSGSSALYCRIHLGVVARCWTILTSLCKAHAGHLPPPSCPVAVMYDCCSCLQVRG